MKRENDLPESAKNAFNDYPHLQPSPAFNRAVLESLASAQSQRRQTLIGRLEEFLGVGLWSFAASGAMGAFLPMAILGLLVFSSHPQQKPRYPNSPLFPLRISPYGGPLYARELEQLRGQYL